MDAAKLHHRLIPTLAEINNKSPKDFEKTMLRFQLKGSVSTIVLEVDNMLKYRQK